MWSRQVGDLSGALMNCILIPGVPLLPLNSSLPCVSALVKWSTTYCLPALCPWHRTCCGRAQSHHHSQWSVLIPPFLSMSNHHSWCCPAALILPVRVFGEYDQNIKEKSLQILFLNFPGELPRCTHCWGHLPLTCWLETHQWWEGSISNMGIS